MNTDNRTDDELNRVIAEWCGFIEIYRPEIYEYKYKDPSGSYTNELPNYCRDLNAVISRPVSERVHLNHVMCEILRENDAYFFDRCINATARQRAEALVRVIETTTTTNNH